jgi:hypothetical protein
MAIGGKSAPAASGKAVNNGARWISAIEPQQGAQLAQAA